MAKIKKDVFLPGTPKLIMVSRDQNLAGAVKKRLEKEGASLTLAYSVRKLRQELKSRPYQLILFDFMSLSADPRSVVGEVLRMRQASLQPCYPAIILLADVDDRTLFRKALSWGVDGIYLKYQDMVFLLLQLRALLRAYAAHHEQQGSAHDHFTSVAKGFSPVRSGKIPSPVLPSARSSVRHDESLSSQSPVPLQDIRSSLAAGTPEEKN